MTDLEKLKNVYDELGIGYIENRNNYPCDHYEIFVWYSNITFEFDLDEKYIGYDISQ